MLAAGRGWVEGEEERVGGGGGGGSNSHLHLAVFTSELLGPTDGSDRSEESAKLSSRQAGIQDRFGCKLATRSSSAASTLLDQIIWRQGFRTTSPVRNVWFWGFQSTSQPPTEKQAELRVELHCLSVDTRLFPVLNLT